GAAGGVIGRGRGGPVLEVALDATEVLADQVGADELPVLGDLLAVRAAVEGDLRDAGDHERVHQPEQDRQDDDGEDGCDQVAPHQNRWVVRPCTTGPSRIAGKNVSAPTRMITPISSTTNVGVSVRIVPGPAGRTFLLA